VTRRIDGSVNGVEEVGQFVGMLRLGVNERFGRL
jgi:hypothetical protein